MGMERPDDASMTEEETEADADDPLDEDAGQDDDDEAEDDADSLLLDEDEAAPNLVPEENPRRVLSGRIELLDKIGEGGMGAVWRGIHLKLQRVVAVKILDESLQLRPDGRERFIREARALALLEHRNVVAIYDCDELTDGKLFLSMELLEGETLRAIIKRGQPLDPLEVVDVGLQVCAAVQAAHDNGILHRDLTPGNIIRLGDSGKTIKVIDWGLCKYLDLYYVRSTRKYTAQPGERLVTPLGCRFGSPDYMAPELLIRGNPGSPNFGTDVYALAVVLYELLTGRHPFASNNRKLPHPIRDLLPGFDYHDLEAALRAALRYRAEERTPTMAEFREGLELARECLLAQREQAATDSAQAGLPAHGPATSTHEGAMVGAVDAPAARAIDEAVEGATPGATPELARVIPFRRRKRYMPAILAAVLGLAAGVGGTLAAQQDETRLAGDQNELLSRIELAEARAETAKARADRCEADAARPPATVEPPQPRAAPPEPGPSQSPPEKFAARVLAAVDHRSRRRADAPRPRLTPLTFSNVMSRLESKVRACARKGGIPDGPITVQIRRHGEVIDAVKVLKFTKDHPSVPCIDEVIRNADLPPGDRPVENFTFSK